MIGPHLALALMLLYLLLLFAIARFADRQKLLEKSIVANPYVYALSLCVYVSAWTFYGSIGRAASTGLEFLPIYLGPVLAMTVGWIVIRKMVRVSKEHRLTSISDFISFRYGRSYTIGAVVAAFSLIMVTPYVALQLIAISTSLEVLSGEKIILFGIDVESKLVVAALLGAFAVIFGARHLDPMERHEGLIAVVAFESLVKILAFLMVGFYVTYSVFDGFGDISSRIVDLAASDPAYATLMDIEPTLWFTLTLVSFFAILFLPRQFHVMAVENSSEKHLRKAMWLFPLYLLLINIFVPAIAWGGLLLHVDGLKDAFILNIPHSLGAEWLSVLVFIGGVSAATAMILVESVAVGTMLLNDLEMPYILSHINKERNLARIILNTRRLNILLVVLLGYLFSLALAYQTLADIGVVSFLAASQLAPAVLGGLYWKRGCRQGAMAGLVFGFLLWAYTALLPTMAKGYPWLGDIVREGPWGIKAFMPTNLLGLDLDIWTNSAFWTLLVNCSLYVLISLSCRVDPDEEKAASSFVDAFAEKKEVLDEEVGKGPVQGTLDDLEAALAHYLGEAAARKQVDQYLELMGAGREAIAPAQLRLLWQQFEKTLTGLMGSSATKMIVDDQITVKPVIEAAKETLPAYDLVRGMIYVAPERAYEVFTDQITHGIEGLCITHFAPEEVRRRWGFKETPIIKLSEERGSDRYISPRNLPLLFMTIKSFVDSSKNSIVLIDSIERIIDENEARTSPREVLDFVYQMELLGHRTHLILAERPEFVRGEMTGAINEIKELLFNLGPLSSYLFQIFSETMFSRLEDDVRREVAAEANEAIAMGDFFNAAKGRLLDDDTVACEPEMQRAMGYSPGLKIPADLELNRRSFFTAIRKLARIIKEHQPSFDLIAALSELMKSYGRSPYEITLIPGTTYIIAEEKPKQSLELYGELVRHGMDGLCLSRYNPRMLADRYNVPADSVIWLTQKSEPGFRTVDPSNFPRLSSMISDFLDRASYPLILLEGMGYLITQSNYETVLRFVQSQRDEIALKSAIMLVHIDPLSLDTKELHRLGSELEPFQI
jgi:Na+/proline symporter